MPSSSVVASSAIGDLYWSWMVSVDGRPVVEVALAGQQLFERDGPLADDPLDLDDVLELGGIDEQVLEAGDHVALDADADVEIDELIGDVDDVLGAPGQPARGGAEVGDQRFEIGRRHLRSLPASGAAIGVMLSR